MTRQSKAVVLDASAVVRALVYREQKAAEWVADIDVPDRRTIVPELFFAEAGNALLRLVRSGRLSLTMAKTRLDAICALPVEVRPMAALTAQALPLAHARALTVYDACYAVLAEVEDAVLVTADRRLADAVRRSELV